MIRVVFRGAVLPAAALRGFESLVALAWELRVFGFVFAVFAFVFFAFDETLRKPLEAVLFKFLRGATFLRELFLFLVFLLVAMAQVYHCAPAQFILAPSDARRSLKLRSEIT